MNSQPNANEYVADADLDRLESDEMDWDAYAEHYDKMCELNPAYQQNIQMLLDRLPNWDLPDDASVCDLGAGTGNYILQLGQAMQRATFWHVDFDSRMIEVARRKYADANLSNVNIVQSNALEVDFEENSFDLVVCINALYAFSSQREILQKMQRWLKNNGRLFLIDFGRKQNTLDWALYMLREAAKSRRLGFYARTLVEGRELLKQNRKTTKGQESGRYWLHTTEEFGQTLSDTGFFVEEIGRCYRNYADFAICVK